VEIPLAQTSRFRVILTSTTIYDIYRKTFYSTEYKFGNVSYFRHSNIDFDFGFLYYLNGSLEMTISTFGLLKGTTSSI
jgi:hypothetical protein